MKRALKTPISLLMALSMVFSLGLTRVFAASNDHASSISPEASELIDEDGEKVVAAGEDTVEPGQTVYYVIGNYSDYSYLTDKDITKVTFKKKEGSKILENWKVVEKIFPKYSSTRQVAVEIVLRETTAVDEMKTKVEMNVKPKKTMYFHGTGTKGNGTLSPFPVYKTTSSGYDPLNNARTVQAYDNAAVKTSLAALKTAATKIQNAATTFNNGFTAIKNNRYNTGVTLDSGAATLHNSGGTLIDFTIDQNTGDLASRTGISDLQSGSGLQVKFSNGGNYIPLPAATATSLKSLADAYNTAVTAADTNTTTLLNNLNAALAAVPFTGQAVRTPGSLADLHPPGSSPTLTPKGIQDWMKAVDTHYSTAKNNVNGYNDANTLTSSNNLIVTFKFYVGNSTVHGDADMRVGEGGKLIKPEANETNTIVWYNSNDDIARLEFEADSDTDKFYSKLSTKWNNEDYESYFDGQEAYIYSFTGSPKISTTSRATLGIYNPFIDNDDNEWIDPRDVVIYQIVDGELVNVTDRFEYRENDDGYMAFTTRVRTLGTYVFCEHEVDEGIDDDDPDYPSYDDDDIVAPPGNDTGKVLPNTGNFDC